MDDETLEREIAALVAVEPAPEFRARLRQRIAEEPRLEGARAFWRPSWKLSTVAVLAAIVIAVVLLRMSPEPQPPELAGRFIEALTYNQPVALAVAERVRHPAPRRQASAASRMRGTPGMQVIVDPSEVAAWHRLLASTGSGRVGIAASLQVPDESMQPLSEGFVLPPVTIEPLTADFREQGARP